VKDWDGDKTIAWFVERCGATEEDAVLLRQQYWDGKLLSFLRDCSTDTRRTFLCDKNLPPLVGLGLMTALDVWQGSDIQAIQEYWS
jgi:hypothetical protein